MNMSRRLLWTHQSCGYTCRRPAADLPMPSWMVGELLAVNEMVSPKANEGRKYFVVANESLHGSSWFSPHLSLMAGIQDHTQQAETTMDTQSLLLNGPRSGLSPWQPELQGSGLFSATRWGGNIGVCTQVLALGSLFLRCCNWFSPLALESRLW